MSATTFGWLVLLWPLLGCAVIGLTFKRAAKLSGAIATGAIFLSFLSAVGAFLSLEGHAAGNRQLTSALWNYAVTGSLHAKLEILVDPISVFMMLVVAGVSTLIHLYSISYMKSDTGKARYFAYLNFFVLSMLVLVLGGNFILLIIGWGMVGTASYLLISFWYRRNTATKAGIKAFVINVVGDVGMVLGTFFLIRHTGTVDFLQTFKAAPHVFHSNSPDLVAAMILLLVGAFAKSAQVPLHTWLPDAMEGPTPVSSLIHAATMVTAGVYLICRLHPLFELAPSAAAVGAIVGCATLLIAGTIGLVQTDIKRIIAYSTMSQIGYMVMGASAGAYAGALFHLMTHAFFKALLFMAAGSLIGAMAGSQSLDKMRGFRKAMPFTFLCFMVGGLALSGIPPFSGWLSKDDIIGYLLNRGGSWAILGILGYVGAFITGLYTFRLIFRAFWGEPCEEAREVKRGHLAHHEHPTNPMTGEIEDTEIGFPGPEHVIAERAVPMKIAMGTLAFLALVGGVLQIPGIDKGISNFLAPAFTGSALAGAEPSDASAWLGLIIGAAIGVVAIGMAFFIWVVKPGLAPSLQKRMGGLHRFLVNKWYFDELIGALIVAPVLAFGKVLLGVVDFGVVREGVGGGGTGLVRTAGAAVRVLQGGLLRSYAALMIIGLAGVALYFLVIAS